MTLPNHFSKRKAETDKKKLMKNLGSVVKMAKRALINHDAYVQADAERKKLNLDVFRAKIQKDLSDSDETGEEKSTE